MVRLQRSVLVGVVVLIGTGTGLPAQAQVTGPAPIPTPTPAPVLTTPSSPLAVQDNLNLKLRKAHAEVAVPVPPTLEIEVLDPKVDPLGNPAVRPIIGPDGRQLIDIPPVVLVHRYYYTGDRSFQGPMLPGGPSIIVVHHPKTGERLYVQTQMLPGAPRVRYTRWSIEYDYGAQAITLNFHHCDMPKVVYRQGIPLATQWKQASIRRHENLERLVERTGIPAASEKIHEGAKNAVGTGADRVRGLGKIVVTPILQIVRSTPLGNVFTETPEQQATQVRDLSVRQASAEAQRLQVDIPTIR